jgi:2-C-methyl-D-erythritol 4-phosphate cytidylyltransferase/2-C-methyl-D-erythritol 2,4-cyclodiphosphate synthase
MDCIVKLEQPKFLPYRSAVRNSIAEVLRTGSENIFVKAKTGEKMGETGQGNAVEAWCSCLLQKL